MNAFEQVTLFFGNIHTTPPFHDTKYNKRRDHKKSPRFCTFGHKDANMMSNKVFICIFCFFLMGILYAGMQMVFVKQLCILSFLAAAEVEIH